MIFSAHSNIQGVVQELKLLSGRYWTQFSSIGANLVVCAQCYKSCEAHVTEALPARRTRDAHYEVCEFILFMERLLVIAGESPGHEFTSSV